MNDENDRKNDDWGMTMPLRPLEKDAADFSDDYASPKKPAANSPSADDWGMTGQNFNLPNSSPNNAETDADFDRTLPNINIPADVWQAEKPLPPPSSPSSADDWRIDRTPYNPPRGEPSPSVWDATAPSIDVSSIEIPNHDISHGTVPKQDKTDDWAMGAPDVNIPKPADNSGEWSMPAPVFRISEGEKIDNLPKRSANFAPDESTGFEKTAANLDLSEISPPGIYGAAANNAAPSPTFQPLPPPPAASVAEALPVSQAAPPVQPAGQSGGSKLIYALGGLIVLLFFGIVALTAGYFLFFNKSADAARQIEPASEKPKETSVSAAPIVTAPAAAEIVLPKTVEYKGAMVLVAAGEFTMGSDADAEESKPAHQVDLPAFYIDKTEVTNAEYKKFCDATGKTPPPDPHLEKGYFNNRPNAPVVGVSFADAKEYAAWAGKRLPTEGEWEKAASWDAAARAKRQFPWGDAFQKSNAAFGLKAISDVGKFNGGATAGGALDMAGNVLEWVDAFFQPYPNSRSANPEFGEKNRVVRGGHFGSKSSDSLKTTKRIYVAPDIASGEDDEKLVAAIIGFRCAVSADDAGLKAILDAQSK